MRATKKDTWQELEGYRPATRIFKWRSERNTNCPLEHGMSVVVYHGFYLKGTKMLPAVQDNPQFATLQEAHDADKAWWLAREFAGVE